MSMKIKSFVQSLIALVSYLFSLWSSLLIPSKFLKIYPNSKTFLISILTLFFTFLMNLFIYFLDDRKSIIEVNFQKDMRIPKIDSETIIIKKDGVVSFCAAITVNYKSKNSKSIEENFVEIPFPVTLFVQANLGTSLISQAKNDSIVIPLSITKGVSGTYYVELICEKAIQKIGNDVSLKARMKNKHRLDFMKFRFQTNTIHIEDRN